MPSKRTPVAPPEQEATLDHIGDLYIGDTVKIAGCRGTFHVQHFGEEPGGVTVTAFGGPAPRGIKQTTQAVPSSRTVFLDKVTRVKGRAPNVR